MVPFWTSYVVRSYAWSLVLAKRGVLNGWLGDLGLPLVDLANSRAATVIGFSHFFTMLLTLTIYASLVQLPPNLRRAAADLGAGPLQIFRFIVWPLALPGVMVGAFLTFALCIGDYMTPQILGGGNDLAPAAAYDAADRASGGSADGGGAVDRADAGGDARLPRHGALDEGAVAMMRLVACTTYMALLYGFIFLPVGVLVCSRSRTAAFRSRPFRDFPCAGMPRCWVIRT